MFETITFEKIAANFEAIDIYIRSITIERFLANPLSLLREQTARTNIWEDLSWHYYGSTDMGLAGRVMLCMRNQKDKDDTILFITFNLNAKAVNDTNKPHVFTKVLQYLFEVIKGKTDSKQIMAKEEGEFIIPDFAYSESHFEGLL